MKKHFENGKSKSKIFERLHYPKLFFLIRKVSLVGFCLLCVINCFAQNLKITGLVVDHEDEPVIGATIKIAGTSQGTVTDFDGAFGLQVEKGNILEVSYIGYSSKKVTVTGSEYYKIILDEDTQVLNEVIVTGYGAVSRKNLTTSIVKVKADEIPKTATSNMSQMLMGRAAGLQATVASAQPGGGVNISIRGAGEPIYVVDGMVMPASSLEGGSGGSTTVMPSSVNRSGLAGLNPEDIESIEVLKDASASIYGIGAANGVVLITTKKGKEGKVKVTYDGSFSFVKNYPYLDMLDAKEYMTYVNAFAKEQYMYNNNMGVYGSNAYDNGFSDIFGNDDIASAQTTNWKDMVLKNGSISSHNITLQGGTNALSYYLSGNFYRQEGTVSNSEMERYTLRSNIAAQITSFLKLSTAININKNENQNGTVGGSTNGRGEQAAGALATAMVYPTYLPLYDSEGKYTIYQNYPNGVAMADMQDESGTSAYNVNFTVDLDIIKSMLTAKMLFGYNNENAERSVYIPSDIYFDQMYKSRGNLGRAERYNSTLEAFLNFNKTFSDNFRIDAVAGMGRYMNKYTGMNVSYTDNNDVLGNDNIGAASGTFTPGSYRSEDEKRSQFARASFDFFDRYVISGAIRRDGTDKFFKDKKYAWFPSVSVAWKIFNEEFIKELDFINLLKLRASYGVTGNDNLGTSLYGSYAAFGNHVMFSNNSVKYIPYYLKNKDYPDVTWEKTVMKNIGLDFSVLKDRVSGSFDYFWNDITDMLGTANSDGLSMFSSYPINGGHIRRYGWDATINTENIKTKSFRWASILTLSHYNSIWKERMPNYDYAEYQQRKDEPVRALYFYRTSGIVNADKSNMPSYQPESYQKPGSPIIKDLNGDGQITVDDVDLVNVVPALYWGFGNTFNYKNWDLDIFIYSQLGLKKYNYTYSWTSGIGLANQKSNQSVYVKDVWHSELNPDGKLPGVANERSSVSLPGGAGTDIGYEDASFLRVRNITLGYNFNHTNLGVLAKYISSIKIYADIQNPFTITDFKGFDPEVNTGGDYKSGKAEYPQTRTFSAGIKLSF
ncbi:MAG: SusC/RagA family TonB-linked outer membrane protein [Tannerella sp.]|jgi:TonB-linked SusC/RagA family outer membrane protein|nr:SusC/RagA family TonB-linked outer membrane protein [Tannerella sp.]